MPEEVPISVAGGNVQKSSSSKAIAILTRGAYSEYVSTAKWRERRWRLFSTFRDWLQSQELGKVGYAIDLISRLNLQSERVLLEEMLEQIEKGQSTLPGYFKEFIEPALEDLKSNQENE
ncbi:MAG: hypothetical protein V3U07_01865 [Nitrospirales bacterium]|jgi:hypothetical protein